MKVNKTKEKYKILEFSKDDIPAGESFDLLGKIFIPSQIYETSTFGFRYQFSEAWKVGGDINGGAQNLKQLFGRPLFKWDPYKLPIDRLYICSSSTPPGGGVHGMCGFNAAQSVLKNEFGINS